MASNPALDSVIIPKLRDLGAFTVRRALPAAQRQRVGPFVFFDQFGPTVLTAGHALDVRPHPHIGLSTLTWLFAGEIQHKDSLGYDMTIRPGEVNWMTAGSGIVHSERSPASQRKGNAPLGGTQVWLALPIEKEEMAPAFYHYDADAIPQLTDTGIKLTLIAGSAYGKTSPVHTESETFFADLLLQQGRKFSIPATIEERAIYLIEGDLNIAGEDFTAGTLVVLKPGLEIPLHARGGNSHSVLLGGTALPGPRHLYWNFVSSRPERLEQAKDDWRHGRFAKVADDDEFIPLPD
jgi:redox-sensitive bicupin YhaK (pirin superfamily)